MNLFADEASQLEASEAQIKQASQIAEAYATCMMAALSATP